MDSPRQTRNDASEESALAGLGHRLGRSRVGQVFCAVVVAAFFFALAYMAWLERDFSAIMVVVGLVIYGLLVAWRILPIPASTRARWVKEEQLAKGRLLFQYQTFFQCGMGFLLFILLHPGNGARITRYDDFMLPCFFFVLAAVSYVIFRRFIRKTQAATDHGAADV